MKNQQTCVSTYAKWKLSEMETFLGFLTFHYKQILLDIEVRNQQV